MIYKTKVRHDAFSFSLAGMSIVAPVIAPPIVASDRISKAMDAKMKARANACPAPSQGPGHSWVRRIGSRLAWSNASQ